jgi:hypothetical protein
MTISKKEQRDYYFETEAMIVHRSTTAVTKKTIMCISNYE